MMYGKSTIYTNRTSDAKELLNRTSDAKELLNRTSDAKELLNRTSDELFHFLLDIFYSTILRIRVGEMDDHLSS